MSLMFLQRAALYKKSYPSFLSVGNIPWINAGISVLCVEFKVKIEPSLRLC